MAERIARFLEHLALYCSTYVDIDSLNDENFAFWFSVVTKGAIYGL